MPSRAARRTCIALALLLTLTVTGGCIRNLGRDPGWGKPSTLLFDLEQDVTIPDRPAVVFIADGIHQGVFTELLAAGELPHIDHYLVDRGVTVEQALASVPTITYANMTSLMTGRLPGHHGIVGNKWFDCRTLVFQDYATIGTMAMVRDDFDAPTVFEMLEKEKTAIVTAQHGRGADIFHENWMRIGVSWFFKMYRNASMTTTARLQNIVDEANETGHWPDLIVLYYPATDAVAHADGHMSETYREMIRVFDAEVGDACKAFGERGFLDRMLLVMVTDHGMADSTQHYDVAAMLRQEGLKVRTERINYKDASEEKREEVFDDVDAVAVTDGNRIAQIYSVPKLHHTECTGRTIKEGDFSGGGFYTMASVYTSSPIPLPPAGHDAIQVVAFSQHDTGDHVTILDSSRGGTAVIRRNTADDGTRGYAYEVTKGTDPLGYADHPSAAALIDGRFHTADEWLAATIGSEHPDLVYQLPAMFDSPRTGDIVLFAAPGWDFGGQLKSGHGGVTRDELVTTMIVAGADLPGGASIPYARSIDLVPTLIDFIRPDHASALTAELDGRSLLDILRAAGQNAASVPER